MINADLRVRAALLIRSYLDGNISNHDFADGFPRDKSDPALHAIERRLWFHYDDMRTHCCEFPLHSAEEMLFRRCALFLDTRLEYEWPTLWHHNLAHPIIRMLTGQLFRSRAIQKAKSAGNYAVWPFLRKADFEEAKAEFSAHGITTDEELHELPLGRSGRIRRRVSISIALLQTGLFLVAITCFLWGVIGHPRWLAGSLISVILYSLFWAFVRVTSRATGSRHSNKRNAG